MTEYGTHRPGFVRRYPPQSPATQSGALSARTLCSAEPGHLRAQRPYRRQTLLAYAPPNWVSRRVGKGNARAGRPGPELRDRTCALIGSCIPPEPVYGARVLTFPNSYLYRLTADRKRGLRIDDAKFCKTGRRRGGAAEGTAAAPSLRGCERGGGANPTRTARPSRLGRARS